MRLILLISVFLGLVVLVALDAWNPWITGLGCLLFAVPAVIFRDTIAGAILYFFQTRYTETRVWGWLVPSMALGLALFCFAHGLGWV